MQPFNENPKMTKIGPQTPTPININPDDLRTFVCDCGNDIFKEGIRLKKLSVLQSPTGQESIVPMTVLYCVSCKAEFNPEKFNTK